MSPVTPGDPFLGRTKARSVPPPRTVKAVKRSITKVESIRGVESISLFLTPYSQSPMDDADKVNVLNGTGLGLTPQEPLALVAKMEPLAFVAKRSLKRSLQRYQSPNEAPCSPKAQGGVDLRVLQSQVQPLQRSNMVRPFNTVLLFFL